MPDSTLRFSALKEKLALVSGRTSWSMTMNFAWLTTRVPDGSSADR